MQTATTAYLAVAFGEFAVAFQPAFRGHVKLLAVGVLVALTMLNWLGLRTGSRTQEAASLVKALALLAFVVACFTAGHNVAGADVAPEHVLPKGGLLLAFVMAIQAVIVTYDGWYAAIYFTEENKNAAKDLPRSSIGGVLACAAIFLLVNGALFHVLPMGQLAHSQMPVADAAKAVLGSRGMQFILLVSLVTAVSTINATFLMTPWILFAMGRDRLLPLWLTKVNARGTPTPALLIGTLLATVLAVSGSFETLIAICSILFAVVYLSGFVSLFVLRRREPNLPRPFKIWGYPWSNLGVLLVSSAFLVAAVVADLKDTVFTIVLVGLTCPVYFVFVRKSRIEPPTVLAGSGGLITEIGRWSFPSGWYGSIPRPRQNFQNLSVAPIKHLAVGMWRVGRIGAQRLSTCRQGRVGVPGIGPQTGTEGSAKSFRLAYSVGGIMIWFQQARTREHRSATPFGAHA
jgi:APA family basic amino acid/polyamine antiporter